MRRGIKLRETALAIFSFAQRFLVCNVQIRRVHTVETSAQLNAGHARSFVLALVTSMVVRYS